MGGRLPRRLADDDGAGGTGPSKSKSDCRRREGGQRSGAEDRRGVAAVAVGIGGPTGEQRQAAVVMVVVVEGWPRWS